MNYIKKRLYPLKDFLILWSTQSVSQLGSSITAFALTLWLYEKTGSSLSTASLTICSYAPYVLMSIFAGALTDRFDKKKTMLVCDVFAVLCTIAVFSNHRSFQVILTAYPVSLSVTALLILMTLVVCRPSRRAVIKVYNGSSIRNTVPVSTGNFCSSATSEASTSGSVTRMLP